MRAAKSLFEQTSGSRLPLTTLLLHACLPSFIHVVLLLFILLLLLPLSPSFHPFPLQVYLDKVRQLMAMKQVTLCSVHFISLSACASAVRASSSKDHRAHAHARTRGSLARTHARTHARTQKFDTTAVSADNGAHPVTHGHCSFRARSDRVSLLLFWLGLIARSCASFRMSLFVVCVREKQTDRQTDRDWREGGMEGGREEWRERERERGREGE